MNRSAGQDGRRDKDSARNLERADQQAILDSLPALIAYWDTDLRNRLANQAYVEYFGMTPGEIFGRHISELLGEELYEKNRPYLERALAGERQEFDREIPTPSGPRYTQALYLPDIQEGRVRGIFVLVTDISARRRAEVALANAEERFRTLFERGPAATLMTDLDGRIVAANAAASRMFGYPLSQLEGMNSAELVEPEDLPSALEARKELFAGELDHFSEERRYRRSDGQHVWAQAEATVVRGLGAGDERRYVLAQLQDVSIRKNYQRELEYAASHDPLTGVMNRRGLTVEFERQAAIAADGGFAGSVLICDLDGFKKVNDILGHDIGDELLIHVADIIKDTVRSSDVVGRLGGDEFAVILPTEDLAGAKVVAEKVHQRLASSNADKKWSSLRVGISIGAAEFAAGRPYSLTLREADQAMFGVKINGQAERRRARRST